MPEWRKVPKTLGGRLREIHEAIEVLVKEVHTPAVIQEYFGIKWDELDNHARSVLARYDKFIETSKEEEEGLDRALVTFYVMGFLTGVRFTNEEDHEPPDDN